MFAVITLADRSQQGKYLSLKDGGSLEMVVLEGHIIEKGKLIDTFSTWGPFFRISFDLLITSFGPLEYSSVLSFKGNDAANNCCNPGDRVPIIQLHSAGRLCFANSVSGNGNHNFYGNVQLNKWHKIEIEQDKLDGKVIYFLPSQTFVYKYYARFTSLLKLMGYRLEVMKIAIQRYLKMFKFLPETISKIQLTRDTRTWNMKGFQKVNMKYF